MPIGRPQARRAILVRKSARWRWLLLALVVVVLGGGGLAAFLALPQTPDEPTVTIEPPPGATEIPVDPQLLQAASEDAATGEHPDASSLLKFYADTTDAFGDVRQVIRFRDGAGLAVVREQFELAIPLDELVHRLVVDAAEQGGNRVARSTTVRGEPAWALEQQVEDPGLVNVEYWFDHGGRRWTVDLLAPPNEVAGLVDRVRLA